MSPTLLLAIITGYFLMLMIISRITSRRIGTETFFDGDRTSPWFLIAFGMIGSGISAVSLVSIPGNVGNDNLFYFQFILGSLAGYLFIAMVLTPVFHRLKVVSIYSWLNLRFGQVSYRTGSAIFMVSQSFGAALRLLLSVKILQDAFFGPMGFPPAATIALVLVLIWLYTNKAGVKTIVWTDALQSFFLVSVILVTIFTIKDALGLDLKGLAETIQSSPKAELFNWDIRSGSHFLKQFISGFLITVALVGLDQSMMQKTLTIADAQAAKKNVLTFSLFIALAQTLFLALGVLLYRYAEVMHIPLQTTGGVIRDTDKLLPMLTLHHFGQIGAIAFFIGVVASTFATIDSCIAALTTSFSYDFLGFGERDESDQKKIKNRVLLGVNLVIFLIVLAFWNSGGAVINTIFLLAGFTYGPLLGLYLTGLFTDHRPAEKLVPVVCGLSVVLTWCISYFSEKLFFFDMGFLNILVNALLTAGLLRIIQRPHA